MDAYAMGARWHMNRFGSTQRQLAVICAKNHWHGSLNPMAQYQQDMTVEEVLADKPIAYPLTRAMCAPVGDGAAAAIVCSEKFLKKLTGPRPIKIRASVLGSGTDRIWTARISASGWQAGVRNGRCRTEDISLAELHDATAYGELHQTEAMGFCPMGEGGPYAETGATKLGGKQPVNTSGGLECRGHPIGASGLAQIYELGVRPASASGKCAARHRGKKRQVEGARLGAGGKRRRQYRRGRGGHVHSYPGWRPFQRPPAEKWRLLRQRVCPGWGSASSPWMSRPLCGKPPRGKKFIGASVIF
jgi:acetyl-CoA acyltransferase